MPAEVPDIARTGITVRDLSRSLDSICMLRVTPHGDAATLLFEHDRNRNSLIGGDTSVINMAEHPPGAGPVGWPYNAGSAAGPADAWSPWAAHRSPSSVWSAPPDLARWAQPGCWHTGYGIAISSLTGRAIWSGSGRGDGRVTAEPLEPVDKGQSAGTAPRRCEEAGPHRGPSGPDDRRVRLNHGHSHDGRRQASFQESSDGDGPVGARRCLVLDRCGRHGWSLSSDEHVVARE